MHANDKNIQLIEFWLLPFCIGSCIAIGYWVSNKLIHSERSSLSQAYSVSLQESNQFPNMKPVINSKLKRSENKRFQINNIEKSKSKASPIQEKNLLKDNEIFISTESERQTASISESRGQEDNHLNPDLFFQEYSFDRIIRNLPNP